MTLSLFGGALVPASPHEPPATSSAEISLCGTYRYRLTRTWAEGGKRVLFVMLNPSTADAEADDPTIRRCVRFALREGGDALEVVNLFAFRSTHPRDLLTAEDPVGPNNDAILAEALAAADLVIAGWGVALESTPRGRELLAARRPVLRRLLQGVEVHALGLAASGAPRHPLYLRNEAPLVRWDWSTP